MMKTKLLIVLMFLLMSGTGLFAQKNHYSEEFGHTLNLGLGIGGYSGYYGYVGHTLPVFHMNYEFAVANSFTLAPFVTFFTYRSDHYRESVIPIGAKATYYFDNLLNANSNWDFYLAGSVGFSIVRASWDNTYNGSRDYYVNPSPLFLDFHAGTEYHLSDGLGIFLDLSTGVSTVGLAIH